MSWVAVFVLALATTNPPTNGPTEMAGVIALKFASEEACHIAVESAQKSQNPNVQFSLAQDCKPTQE